LTKTFLKKNKIKKIKQKKKKIILEKKQKKKQKIEKKNIWGKLKLNFQPTQ
jgi:hypothetical protein